jgi:predicted transcriptional regulator
MENYVIVRRKRASNAKAYNYPILKVHIEHGRFTLSKKAAELIQVQNDSGLMFAFNQKEKRALLFKDDEIDSYILRQKQQEQTLRFTCKDLSTFFIDTFDLTEYNIKLFTFEVLPADEKGNHQLILKV